MNAALDSIGPAPDFGDSRELAPGVRWLRLPLPFPPRHINVYLLDGREGESFLVDTGFAEEQTTALWRERYSCPAHAVVTHFHPDHLGQAAQLRAAGAEIHMSRAEWDKASILHGLSGDQVDASLEDFFTRNGMSFDRRLSGRGNGYRRSVPQLPAEIVLLEEGGLVFAPQWQVHFASGHSPAHALLFRDADPVLAAGDVVLPTITPNISVWPDGPDADPLGDYLDALERLRTLPAATLVLPAHGLPFHGLQTRIEELAGHHAERLQELRELLQQRSCNAMEAMPTLFPRELKPGSVPFAFGETLAHLNRLWHAGDCAREKNRKGVYYYSARC